MTLIFNLALIFAGIIEKLMQFENNCMGATSSVAVMYNCMGYLCIIVKLNVLPCNSNDAL